MKGMRRSLRSNALPSCDQPSRFLSLPLEIRQLIYESLFRGSLIMADESRKQPVAKTGRHATSRYPSLCAILLVNQQIYREAIQPFFETVQVHFIPRDNFFSQRKVNLRYAKFHKILLDSPRIGLYGAADISCFANARELSFHRDLGHYNAAYFLHRACINFDNPLVDCGNGYHQGTDRLIESAPGLYWADNLRSMLLQLRAAKGFEENAAYPRGLKVSITWLLRCANAPSSGRTTQMRLTMWNDSSFTLWYRYRSTVYEVKQKRPRNIRAREVLGMLTKSGPKPSHLPDQVWDGVR